MHKVEDLLGEDGLIDVRKIIATFDERDHAANADAYFSAHRGAPGLHTRPFRGINETPRILAQLRCLLELLHPFPKARVLDFGAGLGWLSIILAKMGLRPAAADISQVALDMIAEHIHSTAPQLEPSMSYVLLDGPRIPLPDASLDRIVCFAALHHVPDPAAVLQEFGRVLTDDGIAVCVEPGPGHSRTPASQYEMREYGVIENDLEINDLWAAAQRAGFKHCELSFPPTQPVVLPLESILAQRKRIRQGDGLSPEIVATLVQNHVAPLLHENIFALSRRSGGFVLNSRHIAGDRNVLSPPIAMVSIRSASRLSDKLTLVFDVKNVGPYHWLPSGSQAGAVNLGVLLQSPDGTLDRNYRRVKFAREETPPDTTRQVEVTLPYLSDGRQYAFDLVAEHVTWFHISPAAIPNLT
jgi:SAM-dependent methyltransferase